MAETRSNSRPRGDLLIELGRDVPMPGRGGLIFGYATLGKRAITEGIDLLASAIEEVQYV